MICAATGQAGPGSVNYGSRASAPAQVEKYTALLTEAVDDGRLTYEEADALTRQARLTRLTGSQLRELRQNAWEATYSETKDADWTASAPVQRREMYLLADALGLSDLAERITRSSKRARSPSHRPKPATCADCALPSSVTTAT